MKACHATPGFRVIGLRGGGLKLGAFMGMQGFHRIFSGLQRVHIGTVGIIQKGLHREYTGII